MGGASSTYRREERRTQGFGGETCGRDPSVDGRIILRWIIRKCGVTFFT